MRGTNKPFISRKVMYTHSMLTNFEQSSGEAFLQGMLQGMAAPLSLFCISAPPPLPKIDYVTLKMLDTKTALAQDWKRIGVDMQNVIDRYGKEKRSHED